jgi:hypothetical protein
MSVLIINTVNNQCKHCYQTIINQDRRCYQTISNQDRRCYQTVNNEATVPRVEVITSTALRLSQWLGLPIWNICVANDQGYVQPVENAFKGNQNP